MIPVYVDLDRTLIRRSTSTLELRNFLFANGLFSTIRMVYQKKLFNRLKLKTWISGQPIQIDYTNEFNSEIISLVQAFKKDGHPVILATASPLFSAERVLAQCPVTFQELITSSNSNNIKGIKKLYEIQRSLEHYDSINFIYIGDAFADLKIMKIATESYFVGRGIIFLIGHYIFRISGFKKVKLQMRPKEEK